MCQSHTGRLTGLWFLPKPAFELNANDDDRVTNVLSESKKFVFSLPGHVLADGKKTVLQKGLNFAVSFPHSNVDMV